MLFRSLKESAARFENEITLEDLESGALLTYGELLSCAQSVLGQLKAAGLEARDPVGLAISNSAEAVASIFGALGAGGCYAPADWESPVTRIISGFLAAGVRLALVDSAKLIDPLPWESSGFLPVGRLSLAGGREIHLLRREGFEPNPWLRSLDSDPVYILRTSGSTGAPKAVVHTAKSAGFFLDWCDSIFSPRRSDCYLSFSGFHFDLSVHDIFLPIRHGARTVLAGPRSGMKLSSIASFIARKKITVIYLTPSTLRLLLEYGRLEGEDLGSLRLALFAGELLPAAAVRRFKEKCPSARVFNLYGPTETNVCFFHEAGAESGRDEIPIGQNCAGLSVQLRAEDGSRMPWEAGRAGELLVSGPALMAGYLGGSDGGVPGLEADPQGRTWYRTGDWIEVAQANQCYFMGRRDRLRKRRSHRISLNEIEIQLQGHPDLVEVAVVDSGAKAVSDTISAFVRSGSSIDEPSLRAFCLERMPPYLVPDRFFVIPELPKTSTGKIDYRKLEAVANEPEPQ